MTRSKRRDGLVDPAQVLGHGERDVLLAEQPEEPAIGRRVAAGEQQDAGRALLADVQILVVARATGRPGCAAMSPCRSS